MSKSKKPQKKISKKRRFSSRDKLVLYYRGEQKEFKNCNEFNKETKISCAIVKDWVEGSLQFSFKGWDINKTRSMVEEC